MKKTGMVVTILLLLGALFIPGAEASAATDGFHNLGEIAFSWDGTDANRTKAPTVDYDYTYGDESSVTYTLPWAFNFYGTPYSKITADTNGNIWFTATDSAHSFNLAAIGRGPVIAAWNDDLSSYYHDGVFIRHKSNPERVVIEWQTETYTEEGYSRPNSFEVVLFDSGALRINYGSFATTYAMDFGSGLSRGDGSKPLSITDVFGNAFALAGRSFAVVPAPVVQIISPVGIIANSSPLLDYNVSNGSVAAVSVDGVPVPTLAGQNLATVADGPHTVTIEAVNAGGNSSATAAFIIDTMPPTVTITGVIDGKAYNSDITPGVSITDANFMESSVTLDGQPFVAGTTVTSEGRHNLVATAVDLAGNSAARSIAFSIDRTPPVSTATVGQPRLMQNGNLTIDNRTLITLAAQDTGVFQSGAAGIECQLDGGPAWLAYSGPLTLAGVPDGTHTLSYRAIDNAGNRENPQQALTVKLDTAPPVVTIAPAEGIFGTSQSVTIGLNEAGNIYYTLDGTKPTTSSLLYNGAISVSADTTITYLAIDMIGNTTEEKSASYVIDTTPPLLTVSTLSNGSFTNQETLNVAGTASDNSGIAKVEINDVLVPVAVDGTFSQAVLLQSAFNTITTIATDVANNKTTDSRTITLDQQAPLLTITSPSDNSKTAISPVEVKGNVDETSTVTVRVKEDVQSATMNGAEFSATVIPEPGWNTIEITARDLADNPSSQKRTLLFDDQKPSLEINEPPQDIRTNKGSLTISGTASDPYTAVGITVTMEGNILTPAVIGGLFSQVVAFTDEKLYPITVVATNEVGTQTTVQRNVIYDKTPPNLTIDPVVTPTNASGQIVTGTREEGTMVTITCATATTWVPEYPTSTTWHVALAGMQQGENRLQASATDLAGNLTTATATILYVPRAPDVTISTSQNQLWPPNKELVPVAINGNVVTYGSDIRETTVSVADEYGKYNQQGLRFGDTVLLEAWREGNDMDGRVYTITAVVTDQAGNRTTRSTTVVVPHDMGK